MAKGLQDALRAAAFDKKYGDFNIEDEKNQQENPASNRKFLIFRQSMIEILQKLPLCISSLVS